MANRVKGGKVVFGCLLPKELKKAMMEVARKEGRTVSNIARLFLAEGVSNLTKK
jgi:hypothetical protein